MSYAAIQALLTGKKPYWLYAFRQGTVETYFTSHAVDIITIPDAFSAPDAFAAPDAFSRIWKASALSHGKIPFSTEPGKSALAITFANSDVFARQYLTPTGIYSTSVVLYRGHLNDPDQELVVKYRGELLQIKPSDTQIMLEFGADSAVMDSKALVQVMQRPCTHAVYFGGCGLNLADWQDDVVIASVVGNVLTVPLASGKPDLWYRAGILQWGVFKEMVVGHAGTAITLARAIPGLEDYILANGSAVVKLSPGCDLTLNTCADRFANHLNYSGFPWMTNTPFDGRSIV
ncbi:MAG: phage BR0599 family protein [Rhodobacteraceae bacterium]|nr:phage BR0599 family protein [Paracoccaceae bacterium]